MAESVTISKEAMQDLISLKEEFDAVVESLELMSDSEFMISYKKAKQQVNSKDFDKWDDL